MITLPLHRIWERVDFRDFGTDESAPCFVNCCNDTHFGYSVSLGLAVLHNEINNYSTQELLLLLLIPASESRGHDQPYKCSQRVIILRPSQGRDPCRIRAASSTAALVNTQQMQTRWNQHTDESITQVMSQKVHTSQCRQADKDGTQRYQNDLLWIVVVTVGRIVRHSLL